MHKTRYSAKIKTHLKNPTLMMKQRGEIEKREHVHGMRKQYTKCGYGSLSEYVGASSRRRESVNLGGKGMRKMLKKQGFLENYEGNILIA